MSGGIYAKPVLFALVATGTILVGTFATVGYPMLRPDMHPKLENLKPYTALQLAGRDIYQREGCVNCHTQTVRPLKTEVLRYGEYSKAGEFAYDRPFLWGSKRTGPDLARVGGKYRDAWHYRHFEQPTAFAAESNMPAYGWLKEAKLEGASIQRHMEALGMPFTPEEIGALDQKNELDALVAYTQSLGAAVRKAPPPPAAPEQPAAREHEPNPLAGKPEAIAKGQALFAEHCADCHAATLEGDIGPNLLDDELLYQKGDLPDDVYLQIIRDGTEEGQSLEGRVAQGGMPDFKSLDKDELWSVIAFIRSKQGK